MAQPLVPPSQHADQQIPQAPHPIIEVSQQLASRLAIDILMVRQSQNPFGRLSVEFTGILADGGLGSETRQPGHAPHQRGTETVDGLYCQLHGIFQ